MRKSLVLGYKDFSRGLKYFITISFALAVHILYLKRCCVLSCE